MTVNPYASPQHALDPAVPRTSWARVFWISSCAILAFIHLAGVVLWAGWNGGLARGKSDGLVTVTGMVYGGLSAIGTVGFLLLTCGLLQKSKRLFRVGLIVVGIQMTAFLIAASCPEELHDTF